MSESMDNLVVGGNRLVDAEKTLSLPPWHKNCLMCKSEKCIMSNVKVDL